MSRVGQKPVELPSGVTAAINSDHVMVKGAKGEVRVPLCAEVKVTQSENTIVVEKISNSRHAQAMWGTTQRLLEGAAHDVAEGFVINLELQGVGYRASVQGTNLVMNLGYSHDVVYPLPQGIQANVEGNVVSISGCNRQKVGQVAAEIRKKRPPEPYKGKGVRKVDSKDSRGEYVNRKEGKKK